MSVLPIEDILETEQSQIERRRQFIPRCCPPAPKPGASSEGDETKVGRSPLAGVVLSFTRKTRRSRSGERLASRCRCDEDGDKINAQWAGIVKSIEWRP